MDFVGHPAAIANFLLRSLVNLLTDQFCDNTDVPEGGARITRIELGPHPNYGFTAVFVGIDENYDQRPYTGSVSFDGTRLHPARWEYIEYKFHRGQRVHCPKLVGPGFETTRVVQYQYGEAWEGAFVPKYRLANGQTGVPEADLVDAERPETIRGTVRSFPAGRVTVTWDPDSLEALGGDIPSVWNLTTPWSIPGGPKVGDRVRASPDDQFVYPDPGTDPLPFDPEGLGDLPKSSGS